MTPGSAEFAKDALAAFASDANARLAELFALWREELPVSGGQVTAAQLFDCVSELTLRGGKRLRPALACFAALCFDHELPNTVLLDAALSTELLQTALLIHDDIMDRDDTRRGGPTVHRQLEVATDDAHDGASLAILAGSVAYALSDRLLAETGLPDDRYRAANAELIRMKYEVLYGQLFDMVAGAPPSVIHQWKTSSYTTLGPMRLGAAVAGAPPSAIPTLAAVATPLGRAFQMRDDLLGVFGESAATGKAVGADLREGKRTDLVSYVLEHGDDGQVAAVEAVLGHPDASVEAVSAACEAIEGCGARAWVVQEIDSLTKAAIQRIERADLRSEGANLLEGVARALAVRDR